jgi:hypothetical protein
MKMNIDVFQAALTATARITCCAVLVSCQKTPVQPAEPPPMMEHAEQNETEPPKEEAPVERPPIAKGSADFLACTPKIEAHLKAEPATPEVPVPKEVTDCCTLQGTEIDNNSMLSWNHRDECCDMLEWSGPFACTPWGPPTPPHMA